jgi:hypothetical protein
MVVATMQIARQSLSPETSYIAKPAASWLDDFLVWMSPEAFGCCRKFVNGNYCPPDDQVRTFPCILQKCNIHTILVLAGKPTNFCRKQCTFPSLAKRIL